MRYQAAYERMYEIIAGGRERYAAAEAQQVAVWRGEPLREFPVLLHYKLHDDGSNLRFSTKETHFDKDKMLIAGMGEALSAACGGMQAVPSVRANMGCGIVPSLFPGIVPLLFDDKMPWVKTHLSKDSIKKLSEKDIRITDEFKMALEHMAYMTDKLYGSGAYVFPVDIQGAVDTAHLVYGDDFFYDLYDDPDFIDRLLDLSCIAIELGWRECKKTISPSDVFAHYNALVMPREMGGAKISEDTTTLLSEEHIYKYAVPCIKRIGKYIGGCYIHFCGKRDMLLDTVLDLDDVYGVNLGNPEKYDMEATLNKVASHGKVYYGSCQKEENENWFEYLTRLRNASIDDVGKIHLLLQAEARSIEEMDEIREAQKVISSIDRII